MEDKSTFSWVKVLPGNLNLRQNKHTAQSSTSADSVSTSTSHLVLGFRNLNSHSSSRRSYPTWQPNHPTPYRIQDSTCPMNTVDQSTKIDDSHQTEQPTCVTTTSYQQERLNDPTSCRTEEPPSVNHNPDAIQKHDNPSSREMQQPSYMNNEPICTYPSRISHRTVKFNDPISSQMERTPYLSNRHYQMQKLDEPLPHQTETAGYLNNKLDSKQKLDDATLSEMQQIWSLSKSHRPVNFNDPSLSLRNETLNARNKPSTQNVAVPISTNKLGPGHKLDDASPYQRQQPSYLSKGSDQTLKFHDPIPYRPEQLTYWSNNHQNKKLNDPILNMGRPGLQPKLDDPAWYPGQPLPYISTISYPRQESNHVQKLTNHPISNEMLQPLYVSNEPASIQTLNQSIPCQAHKQPYPRKEPWPTARPKSGQGYNPAQAANIHPRSQRAILHQACNYWCGLGFLVVSFLISMMIILLLLRFVIAGC